jgi:hypothetical protein
MFQYYYIRKAKQHEAEKLNCNFVLEIHREEKPTIERGHTREYMRLQHEDLWAWEKSFRLCPIKKEDEQAFFSLPAVKEHTLGFIVKTTNWKAMVEVPAKNVFIGSDFVNGRIKTYAQIFQ